MEKRIKVILRPLKRLAIQKPDSSVLLFLAMIVAMVLANTPLQDKYHHFLQFQINLTAGDFGFFTHHGEPLPMLAFVNDALMAVFFFTIGLEIKQEVLVGELCSFRKALLPIIAACGGMIAPVVCYFWFATMGRRQAVQLFRWPLILLLPWPFWAFWGSASR